FDCFDQVPHYHYGPENHNERYDLDKTTAGNPVGWTVGQIRTRLPEMLKRAGYEDLSGSIDAELLAAKADELEATAREMAANQRRTVTHNRGDVIIEAGAIRFGLEYRNLASLGAQGQAIHVLGDVAGQEILLRQSSALPLRPQEQGRSDILGHDHCARHPEMDPGPVQGWQTALHDSACRLPRHRR
ncbi:MAG: hypothetical protein J4F46_11020, partial [Dehalococcoidia bacterium]|nr:hypothetical protein [Dehalococcoidia bacterium]